MTYDFDRLNLEQLPQYVFRRRAIIGRRLLAKLFE